MTAMRSVHATPVAVRNDALDFVKGALVLIMVLYHWLNYFTGAGADVYKYLRFLTPSFILITGFLVSHVYLHRFPWDSPQLRYRLMTRGLKLLLLFVVLNAAIGLAARTDPAVQADWRTRAVSVFVSGDKAASFNILVSIAYFLLLAPLVLWLAKRRAIPLGLFAGVALGAAMLLEGVGRANGHLEMLAIALLGMAAGAGSIARVEALARAPRVLIVAYGVYLAGITAWNVVFPLQVAGVCLSVLLIHATALAWTRTDRLRRWIVTLGQYSLFAYVAQIAALQILRRGVRTIEPTTVALLGTFVTGMVVTIAVVELVAALRGRSATADRMYRAVFA
jgi:peptidoglycan/LPS O-acetylase OafA/YrhL